MTDDDRYHDPPINCGTFKPPVHGPEPRVRGLRELRTAAGLTMGQLARILDCGVAEISRLERMHPREHEEPREPDYEPNMGIVQARKQVEHLFYVPNDRIQFGRED